MCKFLGDKNRVETFAYDWRDSIKTQANELARKISKELTSHKNPVRVLAHSMGGLVARAHRAPRWPLEGDGSRGAGGS